MRADYAHSVQWLQTNRSRMLTSQQRILKTLANLIQIKFMVTIWPVFACLNYVINQFVNLLILSSNLVWRKAFSHQNRTKQMSYKFTQKVTISVFKTTDLFLFFQFARFLNVLFISRCFDNLWKTTSYPKDSCVNLLGAITDEIFSIFDDNLLLPITDEIFSICDDNYEVRRGIL